MQALYVAAPGDFGLTERPTPTPGLDEALVKVARASICHTDVIIRDGAPHARYPVIPGHEFSGVVAECGPAVKYVRPGDRVAVHTILGCGQCPACRRGDHLACEHYDELGSKRDGGFAEYCTAPARHLYKLPDHVSLEEGAMLEPLANANSIIRQAEVKSGERVVVIGPGPIGLLAVGVARRLNPSVLVLVGTRDNRLALGPALGATHTINSNRPGELETLREEILGGKGADVVLECAGTPSALQLAFSTVGWHGRIAIEGAFDQAAEFAIRPYFFLARAITLKGINGWLTVDFLRSLDMVSAGQIDVKPLITHTLPLHRWATAFDLVTQRKSEAVKVQLAP
jgi:2-desacetyl-2-hydroxyethyl bacteriochlorophyllide A dehydrogenase